MPAQIRFTTEHDVLGRAQRYRLSQNEVVIRIIRQPWGGLVWTYLSSYGYEIIAARDKEVLRHLMCGMPLTMKEVSARLLMTGESVKLICDPRFPWITVVKQTHILDQSPGIFPTIHGN